jgi:hypothetical protein
LIEDESLLQACARRLLDLELFQVSSSWFKTDLKDPDHLKAMKFSKSIEKTPIYILGNPRIDGKLMRVSVIVDKSNMSDS